MIKKVLKIGGGIAIVAVLALWLTYLYGSIVSFPYGVITCAIDQIPFAPGSVCRGYIRNFGVPKDDVNAMNTNGSLVSFVSDAAPEYQEDLLVSLLNSGVDINGKDARVGMTALHGAVFSKNPTTIIPLLLAHGANPKIRDAKKQTPSEFAEALSKKYPAKKESIDIIRLLKEAEG